jgi:hypothetical protein
MTEGLGTRSDLLWLVLCSPRVFGLPAFGSAPILSESLSKVVAIPRLNCSFPRESRDMTVPIGTPKAAEISLYERSPK